MKGIGVASGAARIFGTMITAAGAGHKDQLGDNILGWQGIGGNGVEKSKIYTGLGNGISMAGTGASMGLAFGPWGAAIGAFGGFLAGGIGAIIDGLQVTTLEKIEKLKEEAAEKTEENQKAQSKVTDVSS